MGWWRWVRRRWQVLFDKDSAEVELDDEIRFHLEMEIRQHIESGVDATEARRRALVAFGGVERFKEGVRDVRGARILDDFVRDSRVALRSLPKQPAFLLAVLMTLGIGIGGNVAMFGVMERSLFRALPYPDADDLVLGRVTWEGEVGFTVSGRRSRTWPRSPRSRSWPPSRVGESRSGSRHRWRRWASSRRSR
jgi:hypothetical protein